MSITDLFCRRSGSLLCLLFLLLPASAGGTLALSAGDGMTLGGVSLAGQLSVLRDAPREASLRDVTAGERADGFTPAGPIVVEVRPRVLWVRFQLQRRDGAPEDWLLDVGPPTLDEVTLHSPDGRGGYTSLSLGDLHPYAERPVPDTRLLFPVRLATTAPQTFYLRVDTDRPVQLKMDLLQSRNLARYAFRQHMVDGLYLGSIAIILAFNLVFWLLLRDRTYLLYMLYLAALALSTLAQQGYAAMLLPDAAFWADRGSAAVICLDFALTVPFVHHSLQYRRHLPLFSRFYLAAGGFYLLCAVFALLGLYSILEPYFFAVATATVVGNILAALWLLHRGHREYLLFMIAFSVLALAAAVGLLGASGLPVLTGWEGVMAKFGVILHLVLLNAALALRVRAADAARREAERRMLEHARAAEQVLEQRVRDRTLALTREVAMRETLAARLEESLAETRRTLHTQRQFVAMVSHEFRTPLSVIDATSQTLTMLADGKDGEVISRLGKIRRAVGQMSGLLGNFLGAERLDGDSDKPRSEMVDMAALCRRALRQLAEATGVRAGLELAVGSGGAHLEGDGDMLAVAVANLLDNAAKYAAGAAPVTLALGGDDDSLTVEVRDRGPGIAAEEQQHLFDKFHRGGDHVRAGIPGSGLGLYLVRTIVEAHGGRVEVDSALGRGSTFRLRLPRIPPAPPPEARPARG